MFFKSNVVIMSSLEHSGRSRTIKIPAKTNAKILVPCEYLSTAKKENEIHFNSL